jgi:hypothetical protein
MTATDHVIENGGVTALADQVLPLIRTRADLHRFGAANRHGWQMHEAVDALEAAAETADPTEAYAVAHKALASAVKVIARADDSSGIIGDACRRLLALHPRLAGAARPPAGRLADWMIRFQFEGDVDYFELDPVAYARALGDQGMTMYRARLEQIRDRIDAEPADEKTGLGGRDRHQQFVLGWNDRRLAVLDQDVDAIIRTHARDRRVAAWLHDTAAALHEIGETKLAIDWARQAVDVGPVHQSRAAADLWCALLHDHAPAEEMPARLLVFRRWPSATTAAQLHDAAGSNWSNYRNEVDTALAARPRDAVDFALHTLQDPRRAWDLAHELELDSDQLWHQLAKAMEDLDPLATLPIHARLVENELTHADAKHYRNPARRLATMRRLAAGTGHAHEVDDMIGRLRDTHRRRPRLQTEFSRAGLP